MQVSHVLHPSRKLGPTVSTKRRVVCDATFLHGLKQLEILPGEAKGEKSAAKKKGGSKEGSKDDPGQETEPRDLDTAQAIIKDFNIKDLQHLSTRLQPLNDMVTCPSCACPSRTAATLTDIAQSLCEYFSIDRLYTVLSCLQRREWAKNNVSLRLVTFLHTADLCHISTLLVATTYTVHTALLGSHQCTISCTTSDCPPGACAPGAGVGRFQLRHMGPTPQESVALCNPGVVALLLLPCRFLYVHKGDAVRAGGDPRDLRHAVCCKRAAK